MDFTWWKHKMSQLLEQYVDLPGKDVKENGFVNSIMRKYDFPTKEYDFDQEQIELICKACFSSLQKTGIYTWIYSVSG